MSSEKYRAFGKTLSLLMLITVFLTGGNEKAIIVRSMELVSHTLFSCGFENVVGILFRID